MSKRKNRMDPKGPEEPNQSQDANAPSGRERPKHKPEGREHQVHKEILARRMRGGPEPTPEAYARALEQWKNLPGSIVRPPTDITPPPADEPSEESDEGDRSASSSDADELKDEENQP